MTPSVPILKRRFSSLTPHSLSFHFFFFFFLNQRPAKRISTLHIIRRSRSNHSIQKDQKHLGINQYYQTSPHFIFFFIFFFSHTYTLSLSLNNQTVSTEPSLSLSFSPSFPFSNFLGKIMVKGPGLYSDIGKKARGQIDLN